MAAFLFLRELFVAYLYQPSWHKSLSLYLFGSIKTMTYDVGVAFKVPSFQNY